MTKRSFLAVSAMLLAMLTHGSRAQALPIFAHRYGFTCQACHTVVPHLNTFGQQFMARGYRIEGFAAKPVFPVAARTNLAYSGDPDPIGLPKGILDEVELLSAGAVGPHVSYFVEQYVVDGGRPGATRDAWVSYRPHPFANRPLAVTIGEFTLPLPVDPETFRDSAQHYAIFDQTVGKNPFNFFDDKIGSSIAYGSPLHGASAAVALLQGHDKQSGLPTDGFDRMLYIQQVQGPVTLSAYRYDGTRPLGPIADCFWRQGYGVSIGRGRFTLDTLLQQGSDTSANGFGDAAQSSGGFAQLRYDVDDPSYLLFRLDGTNDSTNGFLRTAVFLYGRRFSNNTRFTIENDLSHTRRTRNTLQAQFTIAY